MSLLQPTNGEGRPWGPTNAKGLSKEQLAEKVQNGTANQSELTEAANRIKKPK